MKVCPDCNTWLAELPCADCADAEARAAEKARGDEIIVMLGRLLAVSSTAVMAKFGGIQAWFPLSQVLWHQYSPGLHYGAILMQMPLWLAEDRGLNVENRFPSEHIWPGSKSLVG
jgi:hypothetical protein